MKTIAFLFVIAIGSFFLLANAVEDKRSTFAEKKRAKRFVGLLQFAAMISCETGKSPWSYNNYGCFCGAGGIGDTAVDETDECCKAHDKCYEKLENDGVCWKKAWWYTPYLRSAFSCSDCSWLNFGCSRGLCLCDQAAARCFKQVLSTYDSSYKGYRKTGNCI